MRRELGLAARLGASSSFAVLIACAGGGYGGFGHGGSGSSSSSSSSSGSALTITAAARPALSGARPVASGVTPDFQGNLPPSGTVFPLDASLLALTTTSVAPADASNATLTFTGTETVSGYVTPQNVFELKIPSLSIDATGLIGGVATATTGGYTVELAGVNLYYTSLAYWGIVNSGGPPSYLGVADIGYQTPTGALPTGTATYVGNGLSNSGTMGTAFAYVYAPSSDGSTILAGIAADGVVDITANFGSNTLSGAITGLRVAPLGGGFSAPWNNVGLTGAISGSTISGTTAVTSAPSGIFSLGAGATGTFDGAVYGPNGEEIGAVWSLHDPASPGKTALGVLGATRQ